MDSLVDMYLLHEFAKNIDAGFSSFFMYQEVDGKLYFAGRRDFQIKHMGHRIELEEVERGIDSMDGVERSCCAYNQERSLIIAYYTGTCDKRDLHIALKSRLPVYMVPNRFVHVKSFILNKNGKIDRKQLANLEVVQ